MLDPSDGVFGRFDLAALCGCHTLNVCCCCTVAGVPAIALIDSGAEGVEGTDNVILSSQFCSRFNLTVTPATDEMPAVSGFQGRDNTPKGTVSVVFKMGSLIETLKCVVLDMPEPLDVLVTDKWLHVRKAFLDYNAGCIVVQKRARRHVIKCVSAKNSDAANHKPMLLTASQCQRRMTKRQTWYCLMLVQQVAAPAHESDGSGSAQQPPADKPLHPDVAPMVKLYPTVFTDHPPHGGSQIQAEHETIPLEPGAKPVFRPLFRYSPLELEEMESKVTELLALGYIEPSTSPHGAPVLFVKKPRSTALRMCIDYRALNKLTIQNKLALPRIDTLLDMLGGAKVFSSLDLRQAYHQIKMVPSDVPKSAFRVPWGHFQYKTLSFGLTNAPATFQGVMNKIFAPYLNMFVICYLDDILVFSNSHEEHLQHLRMVFDILQQHRLTMALHKCDFLKEELFFLGHIVSPDGVKVDPAKTDAITKYPQPQDLHQLRSFLGMANFFRKFVEGYSKIFV